jgi:hypothetical protein
MHASYACVFSINGYSARAALGQPPQQRLTGKVFRLTPRWRVDIIRKRAEHLGTVEAATEKEAIEKAAERFEIPPDRRNRIAVRKMGKDKD